MEEHGSVEVEDIVNPFPGELFEEFTQQINPLAESGSFGIDIYLSALEAYHESLDSLYNLNTTCWNVTMQTSTVSKDMFKC